MRKLILRAPGTLLKGSEFKIKLKGGSYVVDNCCNTNNFVAAGVGDQLYDGRVCSHPAGNCRYRGDSQPHSGARRGVRIT